MNERTSYSPNFLKLQTLKITFGVIEAGRAFVALILTARSALEVLDDRAFSSNEIRLINN